MSILRDYSDYTGLPIEKLNQWGLRQEAGAVVIPYYDVDGSTMFERKRNYILKTDNAQKEKFFQPRNTQLKPYGLWQLKKFTDNSYLILCEGESDTHVLWAAGLQAVGFPGSNSFKSWMEKYFRRFESIVAIQEGDDGGRKFISSLRKGPIRFKVSVVSLDDGEDINSMRQQRGLSSVRDYITKSLGSASKLEDRWGSSLEQIVSKEPRKISFIVDKIIPYPAITMVYGASETMKTWWLIELATSIAKNKPFLDTFPIIQPVPMLIIEKDSGREVMEERVHLVNNGLEGDFTTPVEIAHKSDFILNADGAGELTAYCQDLGIKLIAYDAFEDILLGSDVDDEALKDLFDVASMMRDDHGISTLFVDHVGRETEMHKPVDPVGRQVKKNRVDWRFMMHRTAELNDGEVILEQTKNRLTEKERGLSQPIVLKLTANGSGVRLVKSSDYEGEKKMLTKHEEISHLIMGTLTGNSGFFRQDIIDSLAEAGHNPKTVEITIRLLSSEGKIAKRIIDGNHWYYLPKDKKTSLPYAPD